VSKLKYVFIIDLARMIDAGIYMLYSLHCSHIVVNHLFLFLSSTNKSAIVGNANEVLYSKALGHLTYSQDDPATTLDTHFDIASLTKVFSTTSAVALLYERGYLSIEDKVVDILGDGFAVNGKEGVTIENCLLHNAGFFPDPDPCYWYPEFKCPNTDNGTYYYYYYHYYYYY
jgi:hypothetical protein